LRVSELAGLRWNDLGENTITIDERYCRGDWGAPKSESSNATIPVNRAVIERIYHMKLLTVQVRAGNAVRKHRVVKSDGPEDLVFQSVRDGKPIRDNNILTRFIKPAAREVGLGWVNWRSLRTSHAVWLKLAGADVKDAQGQMRHSRASTTLDIYQHMGAASTTPSSPRSTPPARLGFIPPTLAGTVTTQALAWPRTARATLISPALALQAISPS